MLPGQFLIYYLSHPHFVDKAAKAQRGGHLLSVTQQLTVELGIWICLTLKPLCDPVSSVLWI